MRVRGAILAVLVAATTAATAAEEPGFMADYEAWHAKRIERLQSDNGWLTLVGLHWMSEGDNAFGSDPSLPVPLPAGKAPARAGTFTVAGTTVRIHADAPGLTKGGKPVVDDTVTIVESEGDSDTYEIGGLRFLVIRREGRFAIRVKDPESPIRKAFKGIETFPASEAWRVVADFAPYEKPRDVRIPTVLGRDATMQAPGLVKFTLAGKSLTLEPVVEDPSDPLLFFIFKDETSGKETYPAGRFLYAAMPKDGKVVLDFNRAYNPPCAFTRYATCPLPPKKNWLPIRIEAGEKKFGH